MMKKVCGWQGMIKRLGLMLFLCIGMLIGSGFTVHAADGSIKFLADNAKPGETLKVEPKDTLPDGCTYQYIWTVGGTAIKNDSDSYLIKETDLEKMIKVTIQVSGEIQKSYEGQMYCSELPVLYVTTEAEITGKTDYVNGTLNTQMNEEHKNSTGYNGKIEIKWRGNSTMTFPKKPYKIKLDKKTDMFGFGKNKHWVLLANYLDRSFMRNTLSYNLSGDMDMPYMQSVNVVLIMDGSYQGLYQFCEQIRVDQDSDGNRVDIYDWESAGEDHAGVIADAEKMDKTQKSALEDAMATDLSWATTGKFTHDGVTYQLADYPDITIPKRTGGYLIELDSYYDEMSKFTSKKLNQPMNIKNPEPAKTNQEMMNYAANYINAFETAIQNKNFTAYFEAEEKSYSQLFDMKSMVDFWLVNELFMNEDAMKKSTYMYKDLEGLFYMGPIWDMDWAAAGEGNTHNPRVWQTLYFNDGAQKDQWYKHIIKDPYFAICAYNRYHEIRDTLLEDMIKENGSIEKNETHLLKSAAADYNLWNEGRDFGIEVQILRNFLTQRVVWLDQQFTSVETLMTSLQTNKLVKNDVTIDASKKNKNKIEFTLPQNIRKADIRINGNNLGKVTVEGSKAKLEFDDTFVLKEGSQNIITIHYEGNSGVHQYGYAYFTKTLHTVEAN